LQIDPIISTFLSKIKHVDDFAKPEFAPTAPAEQLPFPVAVVTKPRNSRRSTNPAAAGNQDMTRGRANSGVKFLAKVCGVLQLNKSTCMLCCVTLRFARALCCCQLGHASHPVN